MTLIGGLQSEEFTSAVAERERENIHLELAGSGHFLNGCIPSILPSTRRCFRRNDLDISVLFFFHYNFGFSPCIVQFSIEFALFVWNMMCPNNKITDGDGFTECYQQQYQWPHSNMKSSYLPCIHSIPYDGVRFSSFIVVCSFRVCRTFSSAIPYGDDLCCEFRIIRLMRWCWLCVYGVCLRVHVVVYVSRINVSKTSRKKRSSFISFPFIHTFVHSFIHSTHFLSYSVGMSMKHQTIFYPAEIPRNFIALVNQIVWLNSSFIKSLSLSLTF